MNNLDKILAARYEYFADKLLITVYNGDQFICARNGAIYRYNPANGEVTEC